MGFQESLNIACLSRKTHGFDKKDCIGRKEAVPGISFQRKKMKTGEERGGKEIRARSVGANLCSVRMEIYGPLIGGVGKMGNEDGTRCEGMYNAQLLGLIPG